MRCLITTLIFLCILVGCSSADMVATDEEANIGLAGANARGSNQWIWGNYKISISEDRLTADIVQQRTASLYINVTPFVEGPPCPNCLEIGKPQVQPDGTLKLDVKLRHPFLGHAEYTGFDVRGICVFKATDYIEDVNQGLYLAFDMFKLLQSLPFNYSNPSSGGAGLLNADGYTFFLNPLLDVFYHEDQGTIWNFPIFDYSKGKQAYGDNVDTTINPYILFSDGSPRRMFKHNDEFTRTYHIKPPDTPGPFEFGYVVSACWAHPVKTPVTNPETDFPLTANCEDAYGCSIEQLNTINQENYDNLVPFFKATFKHRPGKGPNDHVYILSSTCLIFNPDPDGPKPNARVFSHGDGDTHPIDEETTEVIIRAWKDNPFIYTLIPGWHLGILFARWYPTFPPPPPKQGEEFRHPFSVYPVMFYVEG